MLRYRSAFCLFQIEQLLHQIHLIVSQWLLYMLDKAFIRSIVLFSFTTLYATDLDKVNRITRSTYLSKRFHSSSFIVSDFVPQKRQKQLLPIRIIFYLHPSILEVCFIKLLNSWSLAFFSSHLFDSNLSFDTTCWYPNNIINNINNPK